MLEGDQEQLTPQRLVDGLAALSSEILSADDKILFTEAVQCARSGAHRAAYVITWLSAAESLKRKFRELAQRDPTAHGIVTKIERTEAQHHAVDSLLLTEAKAYGFVSDAEYVQLTHVYQMRSVYAHPYEQAPTPEALLAAGRVVVDSVLRRSAKLRHGYIADRMTLVANDPHFLDDTALAVSEYAAEVYARVADDLREYVLTKLWGLLESKTGDPAAAMLVRRGRRFTAAYLNLCEVTFVATRDWPMLLPRHASLLVPVLAKPSLFVQLSKMAQDMVLAHVLERSAGHRDAVRTLGLLHDGNALDERQTQRVLERVSTIPMENLMTIDVPAGWYGDRIIAELKRHTWPVQNPAISALRSAGPARIASLPDAVQEALGNNVLQAAEGSARAAVAFVQHLATGTEHWPPAFMSGLLAECFINDDGIVRFKYDYLDEVLSSLCVMPEEARDLIVGRVADAVAGGSLQHTGVWPRDFEAVLSELDNQSHETIRNSAAMQALRAAVLAHAQEAGSVNLPA